MTEEKTPKTVTKTCRCGVVFEYVQGRSRPRVWCDKCKDEINQSARSKLRIEEERAKPIDERAMTPTEIVDYLEMCLKARGMHISQHRTD